ncbi:MAG TPA: alpha/beta hydrolase, partial [Acidimicrobiales bacterium]
MEINGFVSLGSGYQFYAPGMAGQVHLIGERVDSEDGPTRLAGWGPRDHAGFAELHSALADNFDRQRTVVVAANQIRPLHRTELKPSNTAGMMHLRVPVRQARIPRQAVVLAVDEAGTATWHFPRAVSASGPSSAEARVGVTGSQLLDFEIPYRLLAGDSTRESTRGPDLALQLPGLSGKKILNVLFFKVADIAVGEVGKFLVSKWEDKNRPTRLRWFTPDNFNQAGAGIITKPNDLADLRNQPGKPILLFLHGTFSTSHGGFGGLPPRTIKMLYDRYEKRVLAFDHATMVSSPELNLKQLLATLGSNPGMTFDIVSHSRGGLVARGLAGEFGSPSGVRVR